MESLRSAYRGIAADISEKQYGSLAKKIATATVKGGVNLCTLPLQIPAAVGKGIGTMVGNIISKELGATLGKVGTAAGAALAFGGFLALGAVTPPLVLLGLVPVAALAVTSAYFLIKDKIIPGLQGEKTKSFAEIGDRIWKNSFSLVNACFKEEETEYIERVKLGDTEHVRGAKLGDNESEKLIEAESHSFETNLFNHIEDAENYINGNINNNISAILKSLDDTINLFKDIPINSFTEEDINKLKAFISNIEIYIEPIKSTTDSKICSITLESKRDLIKRNLEKAKKLCLLNEYKQKLSELPSNIYECQAPLFRLLTEMIENLQISDAELFVFFKNNYISYENGKLARGHVVVDVGQVFKKSRGCTLAEFKTREYHNALQKQWDEIKIGKAEKGDAGFDAQIEILRNMIVSNDTTSEELFGFLEKNRINLKSPLIEELKKDLIENKWMFIQDITQRQAQPGTLEEFYNLRGVKPEFE